MSDQNLISSHEGSILTIEINRPKFLNALNRETISELGGMFKEADNNPEIRAIILTGSGDKAFVAGADIKEFNELSVEEGKALSADGQKILFDVVEDMSKPVIAAINGFALGGGLELALSCHVRVASDNAKLGLPEVSLGLIPGYGGTQRLAQVAGKGIAFEMITSAQMISAADAARFGIVNHVTSSEELMDKAKDIAKKITRNSPVAVGAAMEAIRAGYEEGVDGYQKEVIAFGMCLELRISKKEHQHFWRKEKPNSRSR